ncbi:uncharacterized protein AB675_9346 [Cyphellophora attinorum]|uniref:BTB domain-containing protein n=1 Tax=Cyphellophora attinorum TaxID=1664694 RepID=A0A0N0NNG0_9EURO|nr:uncharacterized protein AB675_9346 [Phialophora attinorum]KPI41571.1 hypothetical protein AB675_9346 [Phialophora attinorum]
MAQSNPFGLPRPPLRYGEPDWNNDANLEIRPRSKKSYEEYRYEQLMNEDTSKPVASSNNMSFSTSTFTTLRDQTAILEVLVGAGLAAKSAKYIIHEHLLTANSGLVKAMMTHGFQEKSERIIRMPEEEPDIFDHYVNFLYSGRITTSILEEQIEMYCLGTRLQDPKFEYACYTAIKAAWTSYSAVDIRFIMDETVEKDPLRELCVEQVSRGILSGRYTFSEQSEKELLSDYMTELMEGVVRQVALQKNSSSSRPTTRPEPSQASPPPTSAIPFMHPLPPIGGTTLPYTPNIGWHFGTGSGQPQASTTQSTPGNQPDTTSTQPGSFQSSFNPRSGIPRSSPYYPPTMAARSSPYYPPTMASALGNGPDGSAAQSVAPISSLFGGAPPRPLFGNPPLTTTTGPLFGHASSTATAGSLFGNVPSTSMKGAQPGDAPSTAITGPAAVDSRTPSVAGQTLHPNLTFGPPASASGASDSASSAQQKQQSTGVSGSKPRFEGESLVTKGKEKHIATLDLSHESGSSEHSPQYTPTSSRDDEQGGPSTASEALSLPVAIPREKQSPLNERDVSNAHLAGGRLTPSNATADLLTSLMTVSSAATSATLGNTSNATTLRKRYLTTTGSICPTTSDPCAKETSPICSSGQKGDGFVQYANSSGSSSSSSPFATIYKEQGSRTDQEFGKGSKGKERASFGTGDTFIDSKAPISATSRSHNMSAAPSFWSSPKAANTDKTSASSDGFSGSVLASDPAPPVTPKFGLPTQLSPPAGIRKAQAAVSANSVNQGNSRSDARPEVNFAASVADTRDGEASNSTGNVPSRISVASTDLPHNTVLHSQQPGRITELPESPRNYRSSASTSSFKWEDIKSAAKPAAPRSDAYILPKKGQASCAGYSGSGFWRPSASGQPAATPSGSSAPPFGPFNSPPPKANEQPQTSASGSSAAPFGSFNIPPSRVSGQPRPTAFGSYSPGLRPTSSSTQSPSGQPQTSPVGSSPSGTDTTSSLPTYQSIGRDLAGR